MKDLHTILQLRVPIIVRLGHCKTTVDHVLSLGPGAIIELPQRYDEDLDLMVNNKLIGRGTAVKIGENFGIQITEVSDQSDRINAMAGDPNRPISKPLAIQSS